MLLQCHFVIIKADRHNSLAWFSVPTKIFYVVSKMYFSQFVLLYFGWIWDHMNYNHCLWFDLQSPFYFVFLFFPYHWLIGWTRSLSPNILQFALSVCILPSWYRLTIYSSILMCTVQIVLGFLLFLLLLYDLYSFFICIHPKQGVLDYKRGLIPTIVFYEVVCQLIKTILKCYKVWFCFHFISLFLTHKSVVLSQCFLSLLHLFLLVLDISIKVNYDELISRSLAFSLRVDQWHNARSKAHQWINKRKFRKYPENGPHCLR